MRRLAILLLSQVLLWALVGQLNHALTGIRVYVFAAALYIAHATLWHPWRTGLLAAMLGGWLCDATTPVAFGTHMLLFAAAHVATFHLRERLPREDPIGIVIIVLLVNFGLFVVFSLTQIRHSPVPGAIATRLLVDLVCSQLLLALIAPWFFALQARALVLAGADRENFA